MPLSNPTSLGLPPNVNPLGNRSAAGEFIQRGAASSGNTGTTSLVLQYLYTSPITFPVAFSSIPIVCPGSNESGAAAVIIGIHNVTTTGCTLRAWSNSANAAVTNPGWVAFGS